MQNFEQPESGKDWTDPIAGIQFKWIENLQIWAAVCQLTNAQYRLFRPDHSSGDYQGLSLDADDQPVVLVSFNDGMDYCRWLTGKLSELGLHDEFLLRLPSHIEWTEMAECSSVREYPWGDQWPPTYGNYGDESARKAFPEWECIEGYDDGYAVSCPVLEAGKNEYGLIGVGGNVYEWTFEAGGTRTELRGGSWSTFQPEYLKISNRYPREPESRLVNFGLRLVMVRHQ
ncbi:MAG: hypothetical protein D6820_17820 [Lentisphaerae bacterium]|nr:MAG: hypothetical protein D6820_17820 [Lentisphaerota bacterium]